MIKLDYFWLLLFFVQNGWADSWYVEPVDDCVEFYSYSGVYSFMLAGDEYRCELRTGRQTNHISEVSSQFVFRFTIPDGIDLSNPLIFMQWHARRDYHLREKFRVPPFALAIDHRGLFGISRADRDSLSSGSFTDEIFIRVFGDLKPILTWTEVSVNIKWSQNGGGFVRVLVAGDLIFLANNIDVGFNDIFYPYFKFGLYDTGRDGGYSGVKVEVKEVYLNKGGYY